MPLVIRIAHGIMAVLFLLSAGVQYNDPAPAPWIALYLAAATATGLAARGKPVRWLGWALIAVCAVWEIHYLRLGAWHTPFTALTQEWHMTDETIVDGREFYALIWVSVWMLGVVLPRWPQAAKPHQ
ncbi:transmembrane 220 family protein [Synoicihabitans lomoniglobus]|uniref:Transmembrane 220 family protein n=1 Tax=Synoicihabitans lomoniglobus TaxID=2909285 RepID=A0AAE9ZXW1_9BACT|nr:transmembrane 220 family protein [Opitutaceae bacterium LMO-M01]WED65334.1 transmembrane 220 family protein [Opitutaceae bacterium LMO-M01]